MGFCLLFRRKQLFNRKLTISRNLFRNLFRNWILYINERHAAQYANKIAKNIQPELKENEEIIIEGPANLFRGLEGVGGKFFLTDRRIIFKSHKLNIQRGQTNIKYSLINKTIKRDANKNGIRIFTNDNQKYDFVVNERDLWIEKIKRLGFPV